MTSLSENERTLPDKWYECPPNKDEIPEGTFVVLTDAGHKKGITGISVIIRTKDREYKPKKHEARCKGCVHAELTSLKAGLRDVGRIKKPMKSVVLYNDNRPGYCLLSGKWSPKREYIKTVLEDIAGLSKDLGCPVEFINVRGKTIRRVDKLAGQARKKAELEKRVQINERRKTVQEFIERGKEIEIVEIDGDYYAISSSGSSKKYRVTLKPRFCECQWWKKQWASKDDKVKYARALPCKHMCALAEHLRSDIFIEFKKPIERVD